VCVRERIKVVVVVINKKKTFCVRMKKITNKSRQNCNFKEATLRFANEIIEIQCKPFLRDRKKVDCKFQ
jgi:hypothetical protein